MRFIASGIVIAATSLLLVLPVPATTWPAGCSAFDRSGNAMALSVLPAEVTFQAWPVAGAQEPVSLPFVTSDDASCDAFFDDEGRYFLAGVYSTSIRSGRPLHIFVFDSSARKVAYSFDVPDEPPLTAHWRLRGFIRGSTRLVLTRASDRKEFETMIVALDGSPAAAPLAHALPADGFTARFIDTAHDRAWFPHTPQWCPLRAMPLAEAGPASLAVNPMVADAANFCFAASLAFPDADTLVAGFHSEPSDFVARLDINDGKGEELQLPKAYAEITGGTLSGDGTAFAAIRNLYRNTLFETMQHSGAEIDVVNIHTMQLVGSVKFGDSAYADGVSFDYRDGKATILVLVNANGGGNWEEKTVTPPAGGQSSATTKPRTASSPRPPSGRGK